MRETGETLTAGIGKTRGRVWLGLGLSAAIQVGLSLALGVVDMVVHLGFVGLCGGLIQWLAVWPLYVKLAKQGSDRTAKGLLIGSLVGVALNAVFFWMLYDVMEHLVY